MNAKSPNKSNFLKYRNTGIYKVVTSEPLIRRLTDQKRKQTN